MERIGKEKIINFTFYILVTLILVLGISDSVYDSDTSFLIYTGRYIVNNGIPHINPFTFVDGLKIIVQQWLYDIMVYFVYSAMGNYGLFILISIMTMLNIFIIYKIAVLFNIPKNFSYIISCLFAIAGKDFFTIRPTIITIFLLFAQIYILEKYKKEKKKTVLFGLVPIAVLEVNMHSALCFMHIVFLLPYVVPPIPNPFVKFEKYSYKERLPILLCIPLMIVSFLLNPYGVDGMLYLFYSYGEKLNELRILELNPPSLNDKFGIQTVVFLLIIACVIAIWRERKKKMDSDLFYFFSGVSILGFMNIRNNIYFLMGVLMISLYFLKGIKDEKYVKFCALQKKNIIYLTVLTTVICFVGVFCAVVYNLNWEFEDGNMSPTKAIAYLDSHNAENKESLKIYTEYNNGAFFTLHGYKHFIDARAELFFERLNGKQDLILEFDSVYGKRKLNACKNLIEKYQFDYMCVSKNTELYLYMETVKTKYKKAVDAEDYVFYERN